MPPHDERFPRSARLTRGSEFQAVLARGRRVHGTFLVVHLLPHDSPGAPADAAALPSGPHGSRLGLTVSRKVGSAVVRNRFKRRVREIFRRELRLLLDGSGRSADVVVRARPEARDATFEDLRRDLLAAAEPPRRSGRRRRSNGADRRS